MNRRDFLKTVGLGGASLVLSGCAANKSATAGRGRRRPNIIFIMSDDHAAPAISAYKGFLSQVVKTPNIDRLSDEGMLFKNCFCTNSICTPSRAVILTGKYSQKNGVRTLSDSFDGSQQTFAKLLQQAGYHTAVIGKWHLKTEPAGFDYYNVLPGQGLYFNPLMKEKGQPWRDGRQGGKLYHGYVSDVITDAAMDYLEHKRPKDKPFCLLYQHKAPHDEWEYDPKYEKLYSDIDIPEPETFFDGYHNRSQAIRRCTQKIGMRHTLFNKQTSQLSGRARKKLQYQIFMKKYLRCAASIDDNVGRVLDYLDQTHLADNTVVMYTSDQGVFLGEHGLYDKRFMYEPSLRMPLLVRYQGEIKPGSTSDKIVLNVDFAETILDYAGVDIPADMQGRSFRPLLQGKNAENWRTSMYYRYWMHGAHFNVAAHFGVRTTRYKLIYYYGLPLDAKGTRGGPTPPEWELFDLQKDPNEMNSVYEDPAYADVVKDLKAVLIRLRKELGDDNDGVVVPI